MLTFVPTRDLILRPVRLDEARLFFRGDGLEVSFVGDEATCTLPAPVRIGAPKGGRHG